MESADPMAVRGPKPIKLYVDASPLAARTISGIPHFTAELVRGLEQHPGNSKEFQIILVITFDKKKHLNRWGYKSVRYKVLPIPMRLLNLLWNRNFLMPMDLLLGRGVYLFPNYRNWPLYFSGSRSLTYIHDLTYVNYPEFVQPKNLAFLKRNVNRWVKRADLVLTGSEYTSNEVVETLRVPKDKVLTVYHGVNSDDYYKRTDQEVAKAKKRYGIKGDYLLYIGSLEPRKNLVRLLRAYCMLPKELSGRYGLCIVGGGGWLNDEILTAIKLAQERGFNIIKPSKYVEDGDLPSVISGATLLVHPALYEGFGLSPLQAMACGTPVLVGGNSSLTEVVGEAGILVNAEDEQDISDKMREALQDSKLLNSMKSKGVQQAKKFTWEKSADKIVKCLREKEK